MLSLTVCRLQRLNLSDNIRNVPRSLWCFSHSNPISFISKLIWHNKKHLATMLRLRPESGVQMQLQLNLAWLHCSVFSVGKHGDAGGALLGSFPSKTSSPVQRKLTPFLQTWFLILAEVGMKCSWLLLDGIPSSRVIWKARCACERALRGRFPFRQQSETVWDSHTAAGFSTVPVISDKLGFSPRVRGPPACYSRALCLLTGCQGACERDHFQALPPDPSLEFIARPPCAPTLTQPLAVLLVGAALLPAAA